MRRTLFAALGLAAAGIALAAPVQASIRNPDPYERFNRRNYAFNQRLDKALIRPLSQLTQGLTPGPIGYAIANVLRTLNEPLVILNDLLQIKIGSAVKTSVRLGVNVTVGLLGTVDAAKKIGLPHHPNGFGDTLGHYGVGPGPYLYLPVVGPSDVRDSLGTGVDIVTTPIFFVRYAYKNEVLTTLNVVGGLNMRGEVDTQLNALLSDAADPYATLKATYLQSRQGEIDGDRTPDTLPDIGGADPQAVAPGPAMPDIPNVPAPPPSGAGQAGLAADQPSALQPLPDQKSGDADHKVPGPLQE